MRKGILWLSFFGFFCLTACAGGEFALTDVMKIVFPAAQTDAAPAQPQKALLLPEASGTVVYEGAGVTVDASHTDQGYVMIRCEESEKRLKARIATGAQAYYYDLPAGAGYSVFPLQMGDGSYTVRVMEQVESDLYALRFGAELTVALADETVPFLYPNQYVWYDASAKTVQKARELAQGLNSQTEIARVFYAYVVRHMTYDTEKAATALKDYLPNADKALASGTGICFDYAALLAAMLRSEGIPAKMLIGTVTPENLYHAWNSVFLEGRWVWMDPTLDGTRHEEKDYITERVY